MAVRAALTMAIRFMFSWNVSTARAGARLRPVRFCLSPSLTERLTDPSTGTSASNWLAPKPLPTRKKAGGHRPPLLVTRGAAAAEPPTS
jgi:hypothetical protein